MNASILAPDSSGRFTPEKLRVTLAEVCAGVGLDHRGARLLRFTNNAVYQLANRPVVVRIVGSHAMRHRAAKVVWFARHLAAHGVPAVRLLPGVEQPVRVGEHVATLWETVPPSDKRPGPRQLAGLLRQLHELPVDVSSDGSALPVWNPLDDVRRRVADAEGLGASDRRFLLGECGEVAAALAELRFPLVPALVHGDAHLGNVIASPGGPVLCDFDSAAIGPPEWDLTPLAVGVARFGEPRRRYRRFVRGYGFDVTDWDGFRVLRRVRELKLITSVLPILRSHPEVGAELRRRLRDFRLGHDRARWQRYR
ncbi:MAG: phosphotransferase [Pseudonocardiaceae bacterium]|nr:phosphotransferase [Pseudonocardiaceae bacterium]